MNTSIGRANLDGSGVDRSFIKAVGSTGNLALDGKHIYWTAYGLIGRANLDGSGVEPIFIRVPMASGWGGMVQGPTMLAVDGGYLYWTVNDMAPYVGSNQLWRARLDGSGVERVLVGEEGVDAVAGGYVYWSGPAPGAISRAKLDGSDADPNFISTGAEALMAVGVFGAHVYWTDQCGSGGYPRCDNGVIGRANLDGSDVQPKFIGGLGVPAALAFGGGQIFWADLCNLYKGDAVCRSDKIARANLDGSQVHRGVIAVPGARLWQGLAVSASHVYFISSPQTSLDALRIAPATFRLTGRMVNGRCRQQTRGNSTRRRCIRPITLRITYKLNYPALVRFAIRRRLPGRMVNGRCVAPTTENRRHGTCIRVIPIAGAGPLRAVGRTGMNSLTFNGILTVAKDQNGRPHPVPYRLTPGSYELSTAVGGGNRQSVSFQIEP